MVYLTRLADRTFDDVSGPHDRNRPFKVFGTFRDSELVTLVEFIRSGPEVVSARADKYTLDSTLPISAVTRTAEGLVEVHLRINETSDYVARVKPAGETWTLVSVSYLIA